MLIPVYLVETKRKLADGTQAVYYTLRWRGTKGQTQDRRIGRSKTSGGELTKRAAMKMRRALETELNSGATARDNPKRLMLSEFAGWYETTFHHGRKISTIIEWRTAAKHALDALGDQPLSRLAITDVATIRSHLTDLGRSDATVRKTLATLRSMLERARRRGLVRTNVLANEPLGPPPRRPMRIYSPAEVAAMIEAAPSETWAVLIELASTSGLRKAELLHLRWIDLDLGVGAGAVHVQPREAGEYRAGDDRIVPIFAWSPKSKTSVRKVPVPQKTVAALSRLRFTSDSPYVFVTADRLRRLGRTWRPGRPLRLDVGFTQTFAGIQRRAAAALAEANWRPGCVHDLRKTFATRAAASGTVAMHELQRLMGHASITTTAGFYTDVVDTAADRLREVFSA